MKIYLCRYGKFIMERFTKEQRVLIIKTFYSTQSCIAETLRKLRPIFGRNNLPSRLTITRLVNKFEQYGIVTDKAVPHRVRRARTEQNIQIVRQSVAEEPTLSTRRRSQQLGIKRTSLQTILKKDLCLFPYKVQITQELRPRDHERRRDYCSAMLTKLERDPDFHQKIIMSDEAHFDLSGFVNKQNSRYWGEEQPFLIHERPLHPRRVTVWCGIWSRGVVGPYFFEDAMGDAVTVNGDRYREMIINFFSNQVNQLGLGNMWFQQDGATCHTARATVETLKRMFPGRLISRNGDIDWPPRSPDLTAPDFFLWGYLKGRVYANRPMNLQQLKQNIRDTVTEITQEMCENVMKNAMKRVRICDAARGGHLSGIIFHV